ncbi:SRPBCC family protein [Streptomyces sp. NPDC017991]|uniref:SRPBCC family protein n=1 Tax=Streptomyces sp. NPDC017991 TaxID=3365026 RepID=UPI00378DA55B
MVKVEKEQTIACTPEAFLGFVLDVERYIEVDDKIGAISWVRRDGNLTEFKFQPRLPGLPLPEPKAIAQMRLTPGKSIDIQLAPLPLNKFNHRMAEFGARFSCEPVDGGIRATRMISFRFNPFTRWMLDPVLRRTLPTSVERELRLSKAILERGETG